jgi:hypothetical protein
MSGIIEDQELDDEIYLAASDTLKKCWLKDESIPDANMKIFS